jgi:hypothetical protein
MKLYLEKDEKIVQQLKKYTSMEKHPWLKYLKKEETNIEIYSQEGIFLIKPSNNKIFQCRQSSNFPIERNENICGEGLPILIDKNNWEWEETYQIPFQHISLTTTTYTFSLFELKQKRIQCILKTLSKKETTPELYDFYFNVYPDTDEVIIKEEICEFLTSLN